MISSVECVLEKNVCFAQTIFNLKLGHFDPMISLGTPVILFKALFMYLNNNMLEDALYFLKVSFPKRSTLTLAFSCPLSEGCSQEKYPIFSGKN